MITLCRLCQRFHPVEQSCIRNRHGLTRRSFFFLTSMAAVGAVVQWTPLPLVNPSTPGSLVVHIEVDVSKFIKQIQAFKRAMMAMMNAMPGKPLHGIIDLHTQFTKAKEGNVFELSCDPEWRRCDEELSILQHPYGSNSIIKA